MSEKLTTELSAGQKELWYWQKKEPLSAAYNEAVLVAFDRDIDLNRLQLAFCMLSQNNPVLRTVYHFHDGQPLAELTCNAPDFLEQDCCSLSEEELQAIINQEYNTPFDLTRSVLRVRVYRRLQQPPLMLAMVHHIACDGWSLKILWNELLHCFVHADAPVPVSKPLYTTYVEQESKYLRSITAAVALEFWKGELEQVSLENNTLVKETTGAKPALAALDVSLSNEQADQLKALARQSGATFFEVILSLYHLSIAYFTRSGNTFIGTPFLNRPAEWRQVAGYFVNALGFNNQLDPSRTLHEHLACVHQHLHEVKSYSRYPFAATKDVLHNNALNHFQYFVTLRNRLFDISAPEGELRGQLPFSYTVLDLLHKHDPQFDLHLEVFDNSTLRAVFHYNTAVMETAAVQQLAQRFQWLANAVTQQPGTTIAELMALAAGPRERLIALGEGPAGPRHEIEGYSQLFFRQAEISPDAIAVKDAVQSWTYAGLADFAKAIASCLRFYKNNTQLQAPVVAICMDRSCELVAAAIGAWSAGCTYMPLDASLPAERIRYMLEDSGACLLVTDTVFDNISIEQLSLGELLHAAAAMQDTVNDVNDDNTLDGSYLLYTSGSTGRPKGVLVPAAGMLNHLHAKVQDLQLDANSKVAQTASVSFDVSVWQTFAALLCGGSVRMYTREEVLSMASHLRQLEEEKITVVQMVPSYLREFLHEAERMTEGVSLSGLRYLVSAGEELTGSLAASWFARYPHTAIANCYGPTEASDNISIHIFNSCKPTDKIPVGRALANMQLYVVDAFGELCQPGITGQVWVSGAGVARGYIGAAAERSAEVFMEDPFRKGRWLYRTGDLGMWGDNGLLYFGGRADTQVKLRGQRVELSEIERMMQQFEGVKHAAVTYNASEGGSLAGYVVWKDEAQQEALQQWLSGHLPSYMVPSAIMTLEVMPMTSSGKTDRRKLPSAQQSKQAIAPPTHAGEAKLLQLWQQVLGKKEIGILHNFFEHGGHSLKAVQLAARVEAAFAIQLPISTILNNPTVSALAAAMQDLLVTQADVIKAPVFTHYPVSGQQQLIWSVCQSSPEASAAYNMTGLIQLESYPHLQSLQAALDMLLREQEALRTNFTEQDNQPCMTIRQAAVVDVQVKHADADSYEKTVHAHVQQEGLMVFDLENDLLMRVCVIISSTGEACMAGTMHHLVADGISLQLMLKRLYEIYQSVKNNTQQPLFQAPLQQYKDYAWWQRQWLASAASDRARNYFASVISSATILDIPTDHIRPHTKSYKGKSVSFDINKHEFEKFKAVANFLQLPVATPVITAVQLALEAFTGQENITTGIIVTGRHIPAWHEQAGLFMNTLPMVTHVHGNDTLEDVMRRVNTSLVHLQEHQPYPCQALLNDHPGAASMMSRVLINYLRMEQEMPLAASNLSSKAELEFECFETADALTCRLVYDAALFNANTAEQLMNCLQVIMRQCFQEPACLVKNMELLARDEKFEILQTCRGAQRDYPVHASYAALFSETVKRFPVSVAVRDMQDALTYEALDGWSNQVAAFIRKNIGKEQQVVATCLGRGTSLAAVVLGIWKAGCVYLPLDPAHPAERNHYILENAASAMLIYDQVLPEGVRHSNAVTLEDMRNAGKSPAVLPQPSPSWLSYLIYTSGSTGRPKGVMVEQRGMINHLFSRIRRFGLDEHSRVAQVASHTFDISIWQMFAVLLTGGQVQVFDNETVREPGLLARLVDEQGITHMQVVPTYLSELLQSMGAHLQFPSLRVMATIGEELKRSLAAKWMERMPGTAFYNTYGPTEASDTITDHQLLPGRSLQRIPIGRPVDNLNIYVLDRHARLCPSLMAGEICVSGPGVGQGYVGLPERTAEVFLPDPFEPGRKMYRTGDGGKWNSEGVLEYLGRRDSQVKLSGHRIELAEIEQVMQSCEAVKQSAVMIQQLAGRPALVGYVVWSNENAVRSDLLDQHLKRSLPLYMMPAQLVSLQEMPLTSSGKIDRKRLPQPETLHVQKYEAPQDKTEEILCAIWEEVFDRNPIGRHDNFMSLGGHSLKATQIVLRIYRQFDVRMDIGDVFAHPTVAQLSLYLLAREKQTFRAIPKLEDAGQYAVSPSQKRIWVLSQMNGGSRAYHISGAWQLAGKLDAEKFKKAVDIILKRHESLRTGFVLQSDELSQVIATDIPIDKIFSYRIADSQQQLNKMIAAACNIEFNLREPGLLRIQLINRGKDRYALVCVIHHLVADGWSVRRMINEINETYAVLVSGQQPQAMPAFVQYRDYAGWLYDEMQGERFMKSKEFWLGIVREKAQPLNLATDHPRPAMQSFTGEIVESTVTQERLVQLRNFAERMDMSVFMVLLSAVKLLLFRYSNQQNITVGSAVAGRIHPDTQDMMGCFINTILLSTDIHPRTPVLHYLQSIKKGTLAANGHQAYPFDQLVEEAGIDRDLARNPLFDVLVNHQVIEQRDEIKLPGLSVQELYVPQPQSSKFDLEFEFHERGDKLTAQIIYNTDLFTHERAALFSSQFNMLLDSLLSSSSGSLVKDVLSATRLDDAELVMKGMGEQMMLPAAQGYSGLFFHQAMLRAKAVAVTDSKQSLSYAELSGKARQIAKGLAGLRVPSGAVVAICMDRSCELVAAAIGAWSAGCTYMPLDASLPAERIRYMLEDSGACLLVTDTVFDNISIEQLSLGELLHAAAAMQDTVNDVNDDNTLDGSYLLYTSGSTGRPKGVLVPAAGMLNHLHAKVQDLQLDANSKVAQTASVSFDVSVWQTFAALLCGGSVRMYTREEVLSMASHLRQLEEEKITVVQMVPSYLREFLHEAERMTEGVSLSGLRYLVSAGEELTGSLAASWFARYPHTAIANCYGPTEASDNISIHIFNSCKPTDKIPVGRALANMQLYVVDAFGELCQPGITGQVWVSGAGVARGYIGAAAERSAEVFMEDPFRKGRWLYRTGDLGMWGDNGLLYFGGRADTQVKLRGQRVELSEIERVMQQFEGVKHAAVTYNASEGGSLAGYVVWKDEAQQEALQQWLSGHLPPYMVPSAIMTLEVMPMTSSGKTDRRKLPSAQQSKQAIAPPTHAGEAKLLQLWQQVLGKKEIGILHNFFEHGGHSLKAMRLIASIEQEFGMQLQLQDIFSNPTVQLQACLLQAEADVQLPVASIQPQPAATYNPITYAQKRMWVISQLANRSEGYNICGALQLEGPLDMPAWEQAWGHLLHRHEVLRTVFVSHKGSISQQVLNATGIEWNIQHDTCDSNGIENIYREHERARFNLETGPLVKATLVQVAPNNFFFVFALHHIIADEWTLGILRNEMLHCYEAACNHREPGLKPLRIQYRDYAAWEQQQQTRWQESRNYWHQQLAGPLPVLQLPADKTRPALQSNAGASQVITLTGLGQSLQQLCHGSGGTLFMGLAASVHILLNKYCNQHDIITGMPVSNRNQHGLQESAGLYLNTLPLRTRLSATDTYQTILQQVKENMLHAFACKDYPFDKLVEELGLPADLSRSALFDVMIVMHDEVLTAEENMPNGLRVQQYKGPVTSSKFDLSFHFRPIGNHLEVELVYNTSLFNPERIHIILSQYRRLLDAILQSPAATLPGLDYIPVDEKQLLVNDFQGQATPIAAENICEQLAMHAQQRPHAIAVADEHGSLDYDQLDSLSTALAYRFINLHNVQQADVVALRMDRSVEMTVAIMAILKAGATYLPVDRSFPHMRVNYILQDSAAVLMITDQEQPAIIPTLCWNNELAASLQEDVHTTALPQRQPGSIAYIIYTSGTTGNPKGVRITDHSLLHYGNGISQAWHFEKYEHITGLLASSIAFDLGYTCLWGCLLSGHTLHLAAEQEFWSPREVLQQVAREEINFIKLTPSHFRLLLHEVEHGMPGGECLELIVLGGEKIVASEVRQWLQHFPHCRIANHYGPTETTIGVLTQVISLEGNGPGELAISAFEQCPVLGKPIGHHRIYVADTHGNLCGLGIWGELHIGGPGLSAGYVNLPELTAQKFIDDPFQPQQKVYCTGDRARWLPGGRIEFAGRMDEQVQLKGYRLEPAEIEMMLLKHPAIQAAAAAVQEVETEMQLVAYVVMARHEPFSESNIKEYLRASLPAYMIPWKLVQMDTLPLTPNGKVNKSLLPVPVAAPAEKQQRQPATGAETVLLLAFASVFKADDIQITDHFFEAGGDSIRAIQLSSFLYHKGWELEVKNIFAYPLLEDMARQMQPVVEQQPLPHAPVSSYYEVSAAQRRLWFVSQLEDNPTVYNTLSALAMEGAFDHEAFSRAVRLLVERHESMRTVFITVDNAPKQQIVPYDPSMHEAEVVDISAKQNRQPLLEEIMRKEGATAFDLATGPLFRIKLVRMQANRHIFIMNMHHIISDGWSKSVLEEEFLLIYRGLLNKTNPHLPELLYQYKDYAYWQSDEQDNTMSATHRNYWMDQLRGELPILQFPTDYPRPAVKNYQSRKLVFTLPATLMETVNALATRENATGFTVLLSAVKVLLRRYSGQDDIITGIPTAGRSRPELQRMVGLFMNLLPVRTRFSENETFLSLLHKIKQQSAEAFQHEDYPFDQLVEQLHVQRDLSRSALFDVLVVSEDFDLSPSLVRKEETYAVKEMETGFSGNKFDLTFYFRKETQGLSVTIGYNATLFGLKRIEQIGMHFTSLLSKLVQEPGSNILSCNYLSELESEEMRTGFNNTIRPYARHKLLHQLFEEAVEKYPSMEALRHNGIGMSYDSLNRSANTIARMLLEKGVQNGDNVGILTERNFYMIEGMLGILKSCAAYVPIDPAYPADRQQYIISNSGIRAIVTDNLAAAKRAVGDLEGITVIDLGTEVMGGYEDTNPDLRKTSTDLAYTIYTSGSSGRPKGVMIEHHSAVNLVEWVNTEYAVGPADRLLFITSMCFDLSVYDIFGMLAAGGCIVIATMDDVQDLRRMKQLLQDERISFWDTVPTTLNYLVTELGHSKESFAQHHLRVAFLSGDWIPVTLPDQARKFFPNVNIISLGGATEGTVWSNYFPIGEVHPSWMSIPYGKPITNNFFYILDEQLNPVPQGVTGELFIGGVGVSRGYINDEQKTNAAFMEDPFCKELGGRMYRTGDLGRMLPDGNMEFLGRKDFQVKIRGFRVELGEIEQVLSRFPGVQTVLVNAGQDHNGIKYLVAYYLGEDDFSKGNFTAFLGKHLPDYMIPSYFIRLDAFPLNTNGKIDRKALPMPKFGPLNAADMLLPRTPTEVVVAGIWSNILNKELFGVQDNFFTLGGHSLSASQAVARIQEEFHVPLKLRSIFLHPTVELLSSEIDALKWVQAGPVSLPASKTKIII
jgi:tyrocidine synthetase III